MDVKPPPRKVNWQPDYEDYLVQELLNSELLVQQQGAEAMRVLRGQP